MFEDYISNFITIIITIYIYFGKKLLLAIKLKFFL